LYIKIPLPYITDGKAYHRVTQTAFKDF
jgi:hypothetical protein